MILTVTLNPSLDEWIHLPSLRFGRVNRSLSFARYPGGKGINVSRVVHELGGDTIAFSIVGGDDGRIFQDLMSALEVPCRFVEACGVTRNNYKLLLDDTDGITEINNSGPQVSLKLSAALRAKVLEVKRPAAFVLAGSLAPGLPDAHYATWVRALKRKRAPVVVDASGAALREALKAKPWLIKPNQHEVAELLRTKIGSRAALLRSARRLLDMGCENAVISLGKEGALLASGKEGLWLASAPEVKVRSAVGSGDSLVAGLVWAYTNGESLPQAFKAGVAVGSACAMTGGTELAYRKDIMRLIPQVRLEKL